MTTGNISLNQLMQYAMRYQRHINMVVIILLALYLIFLLAEITWRFIPDPQSSQDTQFAPPVANTAVNARQNSVNLAGIKRLKLFGDPAAQPEVKQAVVQDAPQTRLNLTLTGVVATTETASGTAVVAQSGRQAVYGIGEKIEGTNASVQEVFADRIIIRNGTQMETLMLDGKDFEKMVQTNAPRTSPSRDLPGRAPSLKHQLSDVNSPVSREQIAALRQQPDSFTTFIKVSPIRENGDLQGYRVNPGSDTSLFAATGLRNNDVVTEINGLDLTDMVQAMEAMQIMRSAKEMQITVKRDGIEEELYLKLPESDEG